MAMMVIAVDSRKNDVVKEALKRGKSIEESLGSTSCSSKEIFQVY